MDDYRVNNEIKMNYSEYAKRLQDINDKKEIDLEDKNIKKLQNRMNNIITLRDQLDINIQDVYKKRNDIYENLITAIIGARYLTTIEDDLLVYENSDKIIKVLDITLKTSKLNEILNGMVIILTSIVAKSTQAKKDILIKYKNELIEILDYLKTLNLIKYSEETIVNKFSQLFKLLETEGTESYSNAIIKLGEIRAFILNDINENEKIKIEKVSEIISAVDSFLFLYQEREANDSYFNSDFSEDLFVDFSDIKSNIEVLTGEIDEDIESYRDSFYLNLKESITKTEEEIVNMVLALTNELIKYHDSLENYCLLIKTDIEYINQFNDIINQTANAIAKLNGDNSESNNLLEFMNKQIIDWNVNHSDKKIDLLSNKSVNQYLNYGNIPDYNIFKSNIKEYLNDSDLSYGTIYICNEFGIKNNNIEKINNYLIYLLNKIITSAYKKKLFTYQNETDIFDKQDDLLKKNIKISEFPQYEIIPSVLTNRIEDLKKLNSLNTLSYLNDTETIGNDSIIIKNIQISLIKYLFSEPVDYASKIEELNQIFSKIERSFKVLLVQYAYENVKGLLSDNSIKFDNNASDILSIINTYKYVWFSIYYTNLNIIMSYLGTNNENKGFITFLNNSSKYTVNIEAMNNLDIFKDNIIKSINEFTTKIKSIWGS